MKKAKSKIQELSLFDDNIMNNLMTVPKKPKYKPHLFRKDEIFKDKYVCFTGKLEYFTRKCAEQIVTDMGGIFVNSVTHKTDFLIVGDLSYQAGITRPNESHKLITAKNYQEKGSSIQILSEKEFFKILRNKINHVSINFDLKANL